MTTINDLGFNDTPQLSDQIPSYSSSSGTTQRTSVNKVLGALSQLPTVQPVSGSGELWIDPLDGNAIKAAIGPSSQSIVNPVQTVLNLANGTAPDAGTLTGAEIVPMNRSAGLLQTTWNKVATFVLSIFTIVVGTATGLIARTIIAELLDLPISIKRFGAKIDGVTDDTTAWVNWLAAIKAGSRAGYLPGGVIKLNSQVVIDLAGLSDRGIKIYGDGQKQTVLDLTAVTTSPAFLITDTGSGLAGFYSSFSDFGIHGNIAGTLVQLGRVDQTDALNAMEFRNLWVGNNSMSAAAIGIQANWVLGSKFDNVVAANNGHGDAWQLVAASFCTWLGGAGTWADNGMHLTTGGPGFGSIKGNTIIGMDYEVNTVNDVNIDTGNARNNTWTGGTFVYNPGTNFGVAASAGGENLFINPSPNAYPSGTPNYSNFLNGSSGIGFINLFGMSVGVDSGNPAFAAVLSANQTLIAGTWTKLAFNTTTFQNGTSYDPTTNFRFTAQVGGRYRFKGLVNTSATNAASATSFIALYKNGSNLKASGSGIPAGTNFIAPQIDATIVLSIGEYVECWANLAASSGSPIASGGGSNSYFEGQYLGP